MTQKLSYKKEFKEFKRRIIAESLVAPKNTLFGLSRDHIEIVPKNLKLSAEYGDDLLGIEDAMKELQSSLKKGVIGSALDFLGGFGVGAGPSSSKLAEAKKKNFRR